MTFSVYCLICLKALAEQEGLLFMETSALSGDHVPAAFEAVITECYHIAKKTRMEDEAIEPRVGISPPRRSKVKVSPGKKINVAAAPEGPPAITQHSKCCGS